MSARGAVVLTLLCVVFLAVVLFFAERDQRAEDRCVDRGGQTWDSGRHCTIGGTVVSTR